MDRPPSPEVGSAPDDPAATPAGPRPGWLRAHLAEVADDPALRRYGALLALLHALVAWWLVGEDHIRHLAPDVAPVCWPLVPGCEALRGLSLGALQALAIAYGALGLVAAALFLRRRTARGALALLALLVLVELAFLAMDFRLRRNQHYMALATTLTFLVVPRRRDTLRVLIVLFYFWAGTLKLDGEWLSGAALYKPVWLFTGAWLPVACGYVVVLELALVWGLLAERRAVFLATFAQVLLFHAFSWPVVGYFYPVLMAVLLAIFPLCRATPPPGVAASGDPPPRRSLLAALVRGRAGRPVYVVAAAFSALQLMPYLYPGDTALTGEGRLYALNMFDARVECVSAATLHGPRGPQRVDLMGFGEARTRCDPILARAAALDLCRRREAHQADFTTLDLRLRVRRASDPNLRTLVDVRDFCADPPGYDPFFHNAWIAPLRP